MRLLIAGGGTGGHLFPGLAVAEALLARDPGATVHFVGTRRGIEARAVPRAGLPLTFIEVGTLKGQGLLGLVRTLAGLPAALAQAARVVRRIDPDVVLGVGGYASGPVVAVAACLGRRTAIMEQNAVPGLTNRWLGRLVDRIFTSFAAPDVFPPAKVVRTGNPIRCGFRAVPLRETAGDGPCHLFVFGGSAGARRINDAVVAALAGLPRLRGRLRVVHQTGEGSRAAVEAAYRAAGWRAPAVEVLAFIDDMADRYAWADLVVCRAGASTVAELTAVGRPAILVPYPFAADDHQEANAQALVQAGAAVRVKDAELTGERLASELAALLESPGRRAAMAAAAARLGEPAAAARVVDEILHMAQPAERSEAGEPGSPPRSGGEGIAASGQGGGASSGQPAERSEAGERQAPPPTSPPVGGSSLRGESGGGATGTGGRASATAAHV